MLRVFYGVSELPPPALVVLASEQELNYFELASSCDVSRASLERIHDCATHCFLMTSDPANVHYMLSQHFSNFHKGPNFKKIFSDILGDGIFVSDQSDSWA